MSHQVHTPNSHARRAGTNGCDVSQQCPAVCGHPTLDNQYHSGGSTRDRVRCMQKLQNMNMTQTLKTAWYAPTHTHLVEGADAFEVAVADADADSTGNLVTLVVCVTSRVERNVYNVKNASLDEAGSIRHEVRTLHLARGVVRLQEEGLG